METDLISSQHHSCPNAPTSPVGNSSCDWLGKCQALRRDSVATVHQTPDIGRATGPRENGANAGARDTRIGVKRCLANEVDCPDPNGLRGRFKQENGEGQSPHRFPGPTSLISLLDAVSSYKFNDPETTRKWVNPTRSAQAKVGNHGKVRIARQEGTTFPALRENSAKTTQNAPKLANEPRNPAPIALNRKLQREIIRFSRINPISELGLEVAGAGGPRQE